MTAVKVPATQSAAAAASEVVIHSGSLLQIARVTLSAPVLKIFLKPGYRPVNRDAAMMARCRNVLQRIS